MNARLYFVLLFSMENGFLCIEYTAINHMHVTYGKNRKKNMRRNKNKTLCTRITYF